MENFFMLTSLFEDSYPESLLTPDKKSITYLTSLITLFLCFLVLMLSSCRQDDSRHFEIVSIYPITGEVVSPSLRFIQINFNQEIGEDAFQLIHKNLTLKDSQGHEISTFTSVNGTLMVLTLLDSLRPGERYSLSGSAFFEDFSHLHQLKDYYFITSDEFISSPLEVISSYPQNNTSQIPIESVLSFNFNNPLVLDADFQISLVNKLSNQSEMIKVDIVQNQLFITPLETMATNTRYGLYLDGGLVDLYGSSLSPMQIIFETGQSQLIRGPQFESESGDTVISPLKLVQSREGAVRARIFTQQASADQSESVWGQVDDQKAVVLWDNFSGNVTNIETLVTLRGQIAVAMTAKNEQTAAIALSVYSEGEWQTQMMHSSGQDITDLILVESQQNVFYVIWRVIQRSGPEVQVNLSYVRGHNGVITSSPEVIATSPGPLSFQKLSHYWELDSQQRQNLRLVHRSWNEGYVTRENRFNHFGEHVSMSTVLFPNSGIDFIKMFSGNNDYLFEVLLPTGAAGTQEYLLSSSKGSQIVGATDLAATLHNQFESIHVKQTENNYTVVLYMSRSQNRVQLNVYDQDFLLADSLSKTLPGGGTPATNLQIRVQGNHFLASYIHMGRTVVAQGNTERQNLEILQWLDARSFGFDLPYLFIESAALETIVNDNGQKDSFWILVVENRSTLSPFTSGTLHTLILKNATPQPIVLDDFLLRGDCDANILDAEIRTWNGHDVLWISDNSHQAFKAQAPAGEEINTQSCVMRFFLTIPPGHRLDVQRPNLGNVGLAADVVFAGNNMGQGGELLADVDWGFLSSFQRTSDAYSTMVTTSSTQSFYGGFFFDSPIQQIGCSQSTQEVIFDVDMSLTALSSMTHESSIALRRLNFYMKTSLCNAFGTSMSGSPNF
jgi:hypothetical protein